MKSFAQISLLLAILVRLCWPDHHDVRVFAATNEVPWYVWAQLACMLAIIGVLCGKQIAAGAASAWGWVRSKVSPVENSGLAFGVAAGLIFGMVLGFLLAWNVLPVGPPSPPKPDVVVPTPIESGPLSIFLIHEAKEKSPALARTITDLRAGAAADYLAKQKHSLLILDDDSKDASGEPSAVLKQWREKYATVKLPALLIVAKSGMVLHADTLKDGMTADNIVELVRTKEGK